MAVDAPLGASTAAAATGLFTCAADFSSGFVAAVFVAGLVVEAAGLTVSSGFAAVCLAAALVALPEVLGALVVLEVAGAAFLVSAFLGSSAGLVAAGFAVDAVLAAGLVVEAVGFVVAAGFAVEELVAFVCAAGLAAGLVVEAVGFAVAAGFTVAAGFAAPLGAAADGAPSAAEGGFGLFCFY